MKENIIAKLKNTFDNVTLQSILGDLSHFVGVERLGPKVSDRIHWRAFSGKPQIALTFDDGPQPEYTPRLLEILEKTNVKATFFVIGQYVEQQMQLAGQMVAAGHELANHTFTHPLMWHLNDLDMVLEINKTDHLLRSLNRHKPRFLRPPMGLFSRRVLDIIQQTGYETVVGDVYPRDPHLPGAEKIVGRVMRRVRNGSIIILHDGGNTKNVDRSQTVRAVEQLIPRLRDRGFEFVTLSTLLPAP